MLETGKWNAPLVALIAVALVAGCGATAPVQTYQDPFGGTVRGFVLYLDNGHITAVAARESEGRHELELMFFDRGAHQTPVPAGTPLELIVGGEIVELVTREDAAPVASVWGCCTVFTQWKLISDLEPDHADALAREPLTAARVDIAGVPHTIELTHEQSSIVRRNMETLRSEPQ